jgi:hypothetical protein
MKGRIAILFLIVAVVAQASWRSDVTTQPIPSAPVTGKLLGSPFTVVAVSVKKSAGLNSVSEKGFVKDKAQNWTIAFAADKGFIPDRELQVWLNTDAGQSLDGKTFTMKPYAFGTPEARKQSYGNHTGSRVPRGITSIFATVRQSGKGFKNEIFSDKFSVRLSFGRTSGNMLPGKIYVSLPDKTKSYLLGSFNAKVKGPSEF